MPPARAVQQRKFRIVFFVSNMVAIVPCTGANLILGTFYVFAAISAWGPAIFANSENDKMPLLVGFLPPTSYCCCCYVCLIYWAHRQGWRQCGVSPVPFGTINHEASASTGLVQLVTVTKLSTNYDEDDRQPHVDHEITIREERKKGCFPYSNVPYWHWMGHCCPQSSHCCWLLRLPTGPDGASLLLISSKILRRLQSYLSIKSFTTLFTTIIALNPSVTQPYCDFHQKQNADKHDCKNCAITTNDQRKRPGHGERIPAARVFVLVIKVARVCQA